MVDLVGFVLGVSQQLFQFGHILPSLPQIERSEILVEAVIDEILVALHGYIIDVEIERFCDIFGRLGICDPVQSS